METTKVALENERKIQQLQMQAISALWKKVSTIQTTNSDANGSAPSVSNNSTAAVHDLAKTCSVLTNQVCGTSKTYVKLFLTIPSFSVGPTASRLYDRNLTIHYNILHTTKFR